MAELDLVPVQYRRYRQFRRQIWRFGAAWVLVVLGIGLARFGIEWAIEQRVRELETLHALQERERQQQVRIAELSRAHSEAGQRIAILEGLRGSLASRDLFQVVDRSLSRDVWFRDWKFRRAGEVVDQPPDAVRAGYFIVIPDLDQNQGEKAWRVDTHMEIRAQAANHASLSHFVQRLVEQDPPIAEVRILNTRTRQYASSEVVDFELAVVVESRP